MNNNQGIYRSANDSTATIRPRNTRLISYVEEQDSTVGGENDDRVISSSTTARSHPLLTPRTLSPRSGGSGGSPARHATHDDFEQDSHSSRLTSNPAHRRSSGALWQSWSSSIQDIAFSFLGSENDNSHHGATSQGKKLAWMKKDKSPSKATPAAKWGPAGSSTPKKTDVSVEERQAMVQAKRREALLSSSAHESKEGTRRHKRKVSDADFHASLALVDDDSVFVYRHKIEPRDTLAGVMIKYGCQPEVFKKVNRFWPNDNVQTRTNVLVPVDACTIRGRKVDGPEPLDLLGNDLEHITLDSSSKSSLEDGSFSPFPGVETDQSTVTDQPRRPARTDADEHLHDSWVELPSFAAPVEVVRISRRTLGYFPPARRKSNSFLRPDSALSTPKTSFDTLRHPPTHAAQQAQRQQQQSISEEVSPARRAHLPAYLLETPRDRSSSTASAPNSFPKPLSHALRGPGGVGTLRGLRTEAARPGPGEDPLNKKFAQYFPELVPAELQDEHGGLQIGERNRQRAASSSFWTDPRASIDSARSSRSNSSTVPVAIEGWMKKLTGVNSGGSPARRRGDVRRTNSGNPLATTVEDDAGDLIELEVNAELSRELNTATKTKDPIPPRELSPPTTNTTGKKNDEELLNERFPIRGRIRRAYEAD